MSLKNNLTNSLSNISSNISSKISSNIDKGLSTMSNMKMPTMSKVKMPTMSKVKMPTMSKVKMPTMSKSIKLPESVSNISFVKTIVQNIGIIILFMLVILSFIVLARVLDLNFSKKEDDYFDKKIYVLKKKLQEGHEVRLQDVKVPNHTGQIGSYCAGTCFKWTTSGADDVDNGDNVNEGDDVPVCARNGCCKTEERRLWNEKSGSYPPWDWKTNKTWQKNNKEWYCHCWLGVDKDKTCCESVVSGVVVPPDDIFSNCRDGIDWGGGFTGFSGFGAWGSSSSNTRNGMAEWMCRTFLGKCWENGECVSCYGSGNKGDECEKNTDCNSNYCHPTNKICTCDNPGMTGDDCLTCDRNAPGNKVTYVKKRADGEIETDDDGKPITEERNICDNNFAENKQWYLSHEVLGDTSLTNIRKENDTQGEGIIDVKKVNPENNYYSYNPNGNEEEREIWEIYNEPGSDTTPSKPVVPGTGKDTRGVGIVSSTANNEEYSSEKWTHHKEAFKGLSHNECFDKTKLSESDQTECKKWWKTARECVSYSPDFCSDKTVIGEENCLQYPCCLWQIDETNLSKIPKWKDEGENELIDRRFMSTPPRDNDKKNEYMISQLHMFNKKDTRWNKGRCVKGTAKNGPHDVNIYKTVMNNYNKIASNKKKRNLENELKINKSLPINRQINKDDIRKKYKHIDEYYYAEFKHRRNGASSETDYYRMLNRQILKIDKSKDNFKNNKPHKGRPVGKKFNLDKNKFSKEK